MAKKSEKSANWPADPAGSPKEYGLTADDKLCEATDPKVKKLLVSKGGFIPWAEAVKYGLAEGSAEFGVRSAESETGEPAAATGGMVTSKALTKALAPKGGAGLDLRTHKRPAKGK